MTSDWLRLSPWEIAFLADAPRETPTPLEHVVATGLWLRDPEIQQAGAGLMALRMEREPTWTESVMSAAAAAAQGMLLATSATAVSLKGAHDACLLSFASGDVATQVVLGGRFACLRRVAVPGDLAGLAAEMLALTEPVSLTALRWTEADGVTGFAWALGGLDDGRPMTAEEAVTAACELVGVRS